MPDSVRVPVRLFLVYFLVMNVSLAIFNLLPFPPLDGSKILETFLPASARPMLEMLEQFGFVILMVLIYIGFFNAIMTPVMYFIEYLLRSMAYDGQNNKRNGNATCSRGTVWSNQRHGIVSGNRFGRHN